MTYEEWLASVPSELTDDPLWKMKVYRLAVFVGDLAWRDVSKLLRDTPTVGLADQLYRAVGSVGPISPRDTAVAPEGTEPALTSMRSVPPENYAAGTIRVATS